MCSVSAMASAINKVFRLADTPWDIAETLEWGESWIRAGNVGNDDVIDGLNEYMAEWSLPGKASVFLDEAPARSTEASLETNWRKLKKAIRSDNTALIYHMRKHYTVIAGYYEEAWSHEDLGDHGYRDRRDWVVIAEHSSSWETPVRMMPWLDLRESIRNLSYGMIIQLRRR